jgi:hypothetical protein
MRSRSRVVGCDWPNGLQRAAIVAIEAVKIERVAIEREIQELEDGGVDETPVLDLAATHHEPGTAHAVDEKIRLVGGSSLTA